MLDDCGTHCELEYVSIGEYRERMDRVMVKTAKFLVGGAEARVNNWQSVFSYPTIVLGN
jgi:type II secretory pathway component PulF